MAATKVIDVNERTVALFASGSKAAMYGDVERFWPEESTAVYAASVVAILEAHGGGIVAEGCPEGGARFVASLPIASSA